MSMKRNNNHKNPPFGGPIYVARKREVTEAYANKCVDDPRAVAARKHMERRPYGGKI